MCDKINTNKSKRMCITESESISKQNLQESNLTTLAGCPEVCLQTARVILYSDSREKTDRVLFDSGSKRPYILSSLAKELGYGSHGSQSVIHSLFGGHKSKHS